MSRNYKPRRAAAEAGIGADAQADANVWLVEGDEVDIHTGPEFVRG